MSTEGAGLLVADRQAAGRGTRFRRLAVERGAGCVPGPGTVLAETDGRARLLGSVRLRTCCLDGEQLPMRLKYADGQEVRLRDRVSLGQDRRGVVVCSIESGEYTPQHPEAQWGYLKRGVMIEFALYGLVHYEDPEPDLQLVARAQPK